MKIVTVVGARPQFIKAAAVSRVIRKHHEEILIHTGQHYDEEMSDVFFQELDIPSPDKNLGIGSKSHGRQTADMLAGAEQVLMEEKPDCVLVYGDTNSTLAGALAAAKLHVPVVHVEAGLRSFNKRMPEEINRVLTDHISSLLLCPTDLAVENLRREGITQGVFQIGDVMCDAVMYYSKMIERQDTYSCLKGMKGIFSEVPKLENWYMATIHRAENTASGVKLREILAALERLDVPVIFPVHPRIKELVKKLYQRNHYKNIIFVRPVGYLTMLYLVKHAIKTITDSGGLQKETYLLGTPCVTVREQTEWTETLKGGHNVLARPDEKDILEKVLHVHAETDSGENYYGDGHAAEKIGTLLEILQQP